MFPGREWLADKPPAQPSGIAASRWIIRLMQVRTLVCLDVDREAENSFGGAE